MTLFAELEEFVGDHRPHGTLGHAGECRAGPAPGGVAELILPA
jgi:hypothetical protein